MEKSFSLPASPPNQSFKSCVHKLIIWPAMVVACHVIKLEVVWPEKLPELVQELLTDFRVNSSFSFG